MAAAGVGVLLTVPVAVPAQADAVRDSMWHLGSLKISQVHKLAQGEGMKVAVLDSGVDANHPDLTGAVLPGIDGWTAKKDGRTDEDEVRHGTGIAALIAGRGHGPGNTAGILGVAPKAQVLPVGVWPPGSTDVRPDNLAVGIRWAVDQGAAVICIAGGGVPDSEARQAIRYAAQRNVPVVAAAGNRPSRFVQFPGSDRQAFGIGAVDRSGKAWSGSVTGPEVDLTAPGTDIQVPKPGGGYVAVDGTSASTALVAGTLVLVRERYPNLTVEQLYNRMKATAVDRGPAGADEQYGWGVIDPLAALTAPVDGEPASPTAADPPATPRAEPGGSADGGGVPAAVIIAAAGFALAVVGGLVVLLLVRRRRTS
ncbi:S8 family serine peptidase [Micromonospora sp. DT31]|uniref:S8 family serine peptidase n=1 Tax=Micromonospora sp. DT31 TaxID=3393434 RepID=UPI003CF00BFA